MMQKSILTILLAVLCIQSGCDVSGRNQIYTGAEEAIKMSLASQGRATDPGSEQMQKRFETTGSRSVDPVQSVLVWSERYEELSVKNNLLREKNSEIREENIALKKQIDSLKRELKQSKKELAEANDFLQKMHLELNEWKGNVLGFRDEMRKADKVQLEALAKILHILGAEPMVESRNEEVTLNSEE